MQVRSGGASGRAAQADDIAGTYPVSGADFGLREMRIESFQAIGVPEHHQVAVTAHVVRDADLSVKGGSDGRSRRKGKVNALVPATVPIPEEGARRSFIRAAVRVQGIYYPDGELVREGIR